MLPVLSAAAAARVRVSTRRVAFAPTSASADSDAEKTDEDDDPVMRNRKRPASSSKGAAPLAKKLAFGIALESAAILYSDEMLPTLQQKASISLGL